MQQHRGARAGGRLSLSVAMITYEGSRYLREQLVSIVDQERLPDEMIISDDGSTDETAAIVEKFAATAPFPVNMSVNSNRQGYVRNMERALGLVRGDVTVFGDQDDVWMPDRLRRIEKIMLESPRIGAVFSDGDMIDEHSETLGYSIWDSVRLTPGVLRWLGREARLLPVLLCRNFVPGATLAFRTEFRELVLPVPPGFVHDHWFVMCLAAITSIAADPAELVRYRVHSQQQLGLPQPKPIEAQDGTTSGGIGPNDWDRLKHPSRTARGLLRRLKRLACGRSRLDPAEILASAGANGVFDFLLWNPPYALLRELRSKVARRSSVLSDRLTTRGWGKAGVTVAGLAESLDAHLVQRTLAMRGATAQPFRTIADELWKGNYQRFSGGARYALADAVSIIKRSSR